MTGRQGEVGITLIELCITVAIIGLVASLSVPSLKNMFTRSKDERDRVEFASQLHQVRSKARSELRQIDLEMDGLELVISPASETPTRYRVGENIASVSIASFDGTLSFLPQGGTTEANPTVITLTHYSGRVGTLRVYPAIGSMRVE